MSSISTVFTEQHHACDTIFADAEAAVADANWPLAEEKFNAFADAMACHLGNEEEVLFPAFEQKSGMMGGPTGVMKYEHIQMRGLIDEMKADVEKKDREHYLSASETLLILMQQHNVKEEQMMYAMCDRALGGDAEELMATMKPFSH